MISEKVGTPDEALLGELRDAMHDDLNTPVAVATLWKIVKSDLPAGEKYATLIASDAWLGLGLSTLVPRTQSPLPDDISALLAERKQARDRKDYAEADRLRDALRARGYDVADAPAGQQIERIMP